MLQHCKIQTPYKAVRLAPSYVLSPLILYIVLYTLEGKERRMLQHCTDNIHVCRSDTGTGGQYDSCSVLRAPSWVRGVMIYYNISLLIWCNIKKQNRKCPGPPTPRSGALVDGIPLIVIVTVPQFCLLCWVVNRVGGGGGGGGGGFAVQH